MGNILLAADLLELRGDDEREPCLIEAHLSFGAETKEVECLIKDISVKGAKIVIETDRMLPRNFHLVIPINRTVSQTVKCELRWRVENTAGVKFI